MGSKLQTDAPGYWRHLRQRERERDLRALKIEELPQDNDTIFNTEISSESLAHDSLVTQLVNPHQVKK